MGGLVLVLVFLFALWLPRFNGSCCYFLGRQYIFWGVASMFFLLRYLGACHPEDPYILVSKFSSLVVVFFLFLFKGLWVVPYSHGVPSGGCRAR